MIKLYLDKIAENYSGIAEIACAIERAKATGRHTRTYSFWLLPETSYRMMVIRNRMLL